MLTTTIRHGDLVIEFLEDHAVQIVRQSNGNAIRLSSSEWLLLCKITEILGWPAAPPIDPMPKVN